MTSAPQEKGFRARRRRISLPLLAGLVLLHIAALYGLARANPIWRARS